MKLHKKVKGLIVLASAGMMFGTSSQIVNAADDNQAASSEEADYPRLGAAQDAPTAPETDEAKPAAEPAKTITTPKQSTQVKASSVSSSQVKSQTTASKTEQSTTSQNKIPTSNKNQTIKPKAAKSNDKKSKKKVKVLRSKKKVVKKKKQKKNKFNEVKGAIIGSLAVVFAGAAVFVYKKIKK